MVSIRLLLAAGIVVAAGPPARAADAPVSCHAEPRYAVRPDPSLPMPLDILCGESRQPAGGIEAVPLGADFDHSLAGSREWRLLDERLNCTAAVPGTLAGKPARLAACTLRGSGWRAARLAVADGRRMVVAHGIGAAAAELTASVRAMVGAEGDAVADLAVVARLVAGETSPAVQTVQELREAARIANGDGDHAGAERAYRTILDLQTQGLAHDDPAIGDTLMRLGLEVSNQGRFGEARSLFERAEPLVVRSTDPLDGPRLTISLAFDAMNRHDFAAARDLARRAGAALDALAAAGGFANAAQAEGEKAQTLLIEASAGLRLGDWAGTEAAAAGALDIIDRSDGLPPWWKPDAMAVLGEVQGRLGRVERGEALLKEAVARFQAQFGAAPPTGTAWLALGRLYAVGGRYGDAMAAFAKGLDPANGMMPLGFEAVAPFFTAAIETVAAEPDRRAGILDSVFQALQRVQSGTVADVLSRSAASLAAADPRLAGLVRAVNEAERIGTEARLALAAENARPDDERDRTRVAWLTDRVAAAGTQREKAAKELYQAYPGYGRLDRPAPVSLAQIHERLAADEGFLTFAFGRDFGVGMVVTAGGASAVRLDLTAARVADLVDGLRQGMVLRAGRPQPFDAASARALYAGLLAPLEPALGGVRRLHVVSAGALSSLPLAELMIPKPSGLGYPAPIAGAAKGANAPARRGAGNSDPGSEFSGIDMTPQGEWLVQRFAVTGWPTAQSFSLLHRAGHRSQAPRPLLAVADPAFGSRPAGPAAGYCRGDGPYPPELLAGLTPLPETADEVRRVATLTGAEAADVLTGTAAGEAQLRARDPGKYRILYFATHGLLPSELRCLSQPGLALTPPAAATSKDGDGLLEAGEIAALRLDADLVVLSACNTAVSAGAFGGEALSSLAESFFVAGARSVLATHWQVPSAATVRLMTTLFARHAAAPESDWAEALQQAQRAMVADPATAHPVYWAGFALMGGEGMR